MGTRRIILGDNLRVLAGLPDASVDLIYIDPPFNTGKQQRRARIRVTSDPQGERGGFGGRRYRSHAVGSAGFEDSFAY